MGNAFTCGLLANTSITCWGIGFGGSTAPPVGTGFKQLSTHDSTTCALHNDGSVACWGGEADSEFSPTGTFTQVAAGAGASFFGDTGWTYDQFSCGLLTDGSIDCWGTLDLPALEPPEGNNFVAVSAGSQFMCALDTDGVVQCWGELVRPPVLGLP